MVPPGVVCRAESFENLSCEVERPLDRETSLQAVTQSVAFHQLRYEVVRADIVKRANVRMIQGGDGASLLLKAVREVLPGELDRDVAAQPGVARLVHLTHAAGADWP